MPRLVMYQPKIIIGLPAYNEEESIDPLFEKIKRLKASCVWDVSVIVYDDGSTDKTAEAVKRWTSVLDITYIAGVINKGLGAGINKLLSTFNAIATPRDVLVVMDCDDTHDPAQIPDMLDKFRASGGAAVVIASRYRGGAVSTGVPAHRVLLSIAAAILYKLVMPFSNVRDYTCGYRLYSHELVGDLTRCYGDDILRERGFACMVELLLKCKSVGAKGSEIPLKLAYDNKRSESKMDVSQNSLRLLRKLISWRLKGIAS